MTPITGKATFMATVETLSESYGSSTDIREKEPRASLVETILCAATQPRTCAWNFGPGAFTDVGATVQGIPAI